MNLVNRQLTLNHNPANDVVECIARCRVELNGLETAALANPLHPGFRLRCVLEAVDPGVNTVLFQYPRSVTLRGPGALLQLEAVFTTEVSRDLLDEDANSSDEIRASFTLTDLSNGVSTRRRSGQAVLA